MDPKKTELGLKKLAGQILERAGGLPLRIFIRMKKGLLVRFTNNGVYQNGFQDQLIYQLRCRTKSGAVCVHSDDDSMEGIEDALSTIRKAIGKAVLPSVSKRTGVSKSNEFFPIAIEEADELASRSIGEGLDLIRRNRASANGYFSAYERFFYFLDTIGRELFHPATAVRFGTTVTRGAGKGYHSFYHPDRRKLKVSEVVRRALDWAERGSSDEVELEPREYECILSPRAFLELIEPLRRHFDSDLCQKGKSVFSGLLGKKLFAPAFTLSDDVTAPGQFGVPFDAEGVPRRKIALVERGVLKGLLGEGAATQGMRDDPVYPENLTAKGGSGSLEELFKRIKKGIFINKIRYHTLVREAGMEVTGLATAGCLYVENGQVVGRVNHLRYHDSLLSILGSITDASQERFLLKDGEMGAALLPYFLISKLRVV